MKFYYSFIFLFVGVFGFAQSPLSTGTNVKLEITQTGVYKIDYALMSRMLGSAPTNLSKEDISVFGDKGRPLQQFNSDISSYYNKQIAVQYFGFEDGQFDTEDYILFFAEGPSSWEYNASRDRFELVSNVYSNSNYYFVHIGGSQPAVKEVQNGDGDMSGVELTEVYDDHQYYDPNTLNVLQELTQNGSGQIWYDRDNLIRIGAENIDFGPFFDLDNISQSSPINVWFGFAGRSARTQNVNIHVGSSSFTERIRSVDLNNFETQFARSVSFDRTILDHSNLNENFGVSYSVNSKQEGGWIDFVALKSKKEINLSNIDRKYLWFTGLDEIGDFSFEADNDQLNFWDITESNTPKELSIEAGVVFMANSDNAVQVYAFNPNNLINIAGFERIENQNLEGLTESDYLIITHSDFEDQARRLLEHRRSYNNLQSPALVDIQQIYNEYSSGKCDPTAVRNFLRQIYTSDDQFNYVVLFGDGSFDYRHVYDQFPDENFIPVYETVNSLHSIFSFPTDDYYALLSSHDGGSLEGALDIAIGRLPVRSISEARVVVDKIIDYDLGIDQDYSWVSDITIVADDEDGNRHQNQAESVADTIANRANEFNVKKIYADFYTEEQGLDGEVNINARKIINQSINQGQAIINYIGHGGSFGWAHERILTKEDVASWQNSQRLPLFVTATCSFAGYDDPSGISAGEQAILRADGGGIALFTTVRAVFSNDNARLTRSVFRQLTTKKDGRYTPLGETLKLSKNSNRADTTDNVNARKFTLLGDPLLKLKLPDQDINITHINGEEVTTGSSDTVSALELISVSGSVMDANGDLDVNFNGIANVRLYDKPIVLKTLGQDADSRVQEFETQNQIIFKGRTKVESGQFTIEFYIPKDINYVLGQGKISVTAIEDNQDLAIGFYDELVIGGTSKTTISDEVGPDITAYIETADFQNHDVVPASTFLYINLFDEQGINIAGQGIGHEIEAVLDGDNRNRFILNDFFESSIEDTKKGSIVFPLNDLSTGEHILVIRAWDNFNNPSEYTLIFNVGENGDGGFVRLLNYPNPFRHTTTFQIEQDFARGEIEYIIEIYSNIGRLINRIQVIDASGSSVIEVEWDESNIALGSVFPGTYFYRVKAIIKDLNTDQQELRTSEFRPLVKIQ